MCITIIYHSSSYRPASRAPHPPSVSRLPQSSALRTKFFSLLRRRILIAVKTNCHILFIDAPYSLNIGRSWASASSTNGALHTGVCPILIPGRICINYMVYDGSVEGPKTILLVRSNHLSVSSQHRRDPDTSLNVFQLPCLTQLRDCSCSVNFYGFHGGHAPTVESFHALMGLYWAMFLAATIVMTFHVARKTPIGKIFLSNQLCNPNVIRSCILRLIKL